MEVKTIFTFVLMMGSVFLALAQESVTESGSVIEEESSTGASASDLKRGRSLLVEKKSIAKSESRRNPKFGFTIPFPNIPGTGGDGNTTPSPNPDTNIFGGITGDFPGSTAQIGGTALLIKGGILSGLMALKAAILPPIFLGALILFLLAGAGFFTCSIVNCNRIIGDIAGSSASPGFGGLPPFNPFNRNGIDDYDPRPVYQGIDDSYKKYK